MNLLGILTRAEVENYDTIEFIDRKTGEFTYAITRLQRAIGAKFGTGVARYISYQDYYEVWG